jgi:anti-sigma regulatory factor (Ser/Thr protein kinase)
MTTLDGTAVRPGRSYRHEAFFYRSDDDYLAGTLAMVRGGLAAGEPVMVAVPGRRLELLRQALGPDAERVQLTDMTELGRNPANIIAGWAAFIAAAPAGTPLRGIGEPVWPGRSADEIEECQLHEALLNLAVAPDTPLWLRCPYDASALPDAVLGAAHLSHPLLTEGEADSGSRSYGGAHHASTLLGAELPPAPEDARCLPFTRAELRDVRSLVLEQSALAGLADDRSDDLALAVHELATNSVRHGGGRGTLRVWRGAAGVVCEVQDRGVVKDPLVGRRTVSDRAEGGRGVWMANQLCDLVQLRTSAGGTQVRVTASTG